MHKTLKQLFIVLMLQLTNNCKKDVFNLASDNELYVFDDNSIQKKNLVSVSKYRGCSWEVYMYNS